MNPINTGSGTSFPLRTPLNNQPDTGPVEQPAADPKKADKQALPDPEVRSGQANLQRFFATHGKASGGSDLQPDAETGGGNGDAGKLPQSGQSYANQTHVTAAEGSGVRRRASRVQGGDSTNQATEASEAFQGHQGRELGLAAKLYIKTMKMLVSALALSAGYRLVRNPGDFVRHPMAALEGAISFSERVDGQTLQEAQHAVLGQFGSYIPANAKCHQVRAEVLFDMESVGIPSGIPAAYNRESNWLVLAPYHARNSGLHGAVHEYCHCFTHPQFLEALKSSPNKLDIEESLTEHISDKIPAYGRLSNLMSKIDSGYDIETLSNGKKMRQATQELEAAVGDATLMRAYFGGDAAAIRKVSRAAVNIFPKSVTLGAWNAIEKVAGNKDKSYTQQLAECFVGASLVGEGKLPPYINNLSYASNYLSVYDFSQINAKQQKEITNQAKQVRERLGAKFDQAFYNFDEKAAKMAMRAVHEDLRANWKCVLPEKASFF